MNLSILVRGYPEIFATVAARLHPRDACAFAAVAVVFRQFGGNAHCIHWRAYAACTRALNAIDYVASMPQPFARNVSMRRMGDRYVYYMYTHYVVNGENRQIAGWFTSNTSVDILHGDVCRGNLISIDERGYNRHEFSRVVIYLDSIVTGCPMRAGTISAYYESYGYTVL